MWLLCCSMLFVWLDTYEDILLALVLNGSNDSCSNHGLLPGLGEVEEVETISVTLKNVSFHLLSDVLGADVNLNNKEGTIPLLRVFVSQEKRLWQIVYLLRQQSC